ncbi:MAG TPA: OmpA family protein [Polyangiaceae bacterium]
MSSARPAAPLALLLVLASLGATGCVLKRDYDKTVADAAQAKAAADADHKSAEARIADLQAQLTQAQGEVQDREGRLNDLTTTSHNMQAQLDEATAINQQLRGELERLGKDADKLLAERGTLSKALDDAKARLDELRKAQAAAEVRTALFRDLALRFKPLIDAGQLRIDNRRGELVVDLSGDLLFDAGHAEVRTVGKGVLMELAHALQQLPPPPAGQGSPRRFLVTSHVDDAPLKSKHYKSTWELTTARAAAAVEYLVSLGLPAESFTAAGAGSFDPMVPNDSTDDRAKNRRLEIALLPAAPPAATAPAPAPAPASPPAAAAVPPAKAPAPK